MASDQPRATGETQSSRRVKYGTNVTIAVVAAVLIVILVNAIGYKRLLHVRVDMTKGHRYSLSDLTRKVVKGLEGEWRMVLLISETNEYHKRALELIKEYGHLSGNLSVESIDPASEGRMLKFYASLLERYESGLAPLRAAIEQGRTVVADVRQDLESHLALLRQMLDTELDDGDLKRFVRGAAQEFGRIQSKCESINESLPKELESPMPDYSGLVATLKSELGDYDKGVFALWVDQFKILADHSSTPDVAKEQLLRLARDVEETRKGIAGTVEKLQAAKAEEEYDKLRNRIGAETVMLIGPGSKAPRVVRVTEMFKAPDMQQVQEGVRPEMTFLGEEKITGALVAMSLDDPPLVVFVAAGQMGALGPRGEYNRVARRLQDMNFEVREWSMVARPGPYGQPTPPGPPPEPKAGQRTVWIVPPVPAPDPRRQQMPGANAASDVVSHLKKRLNAGDAVMVMVVKPQQPSFAMGDPVADLAKDWGVNPQVDRVVMRQIILQDRRTFTTPQMDVTRWADEPAITKAISGMSGVFAWTSPLVIESDGSDGNRKAWPLATVTGQGLWAETEQVLDPQKCKPKPETAADSFTIAAAIEQGDNRMVVVCDPIWATDEATGMGLGGRGTADIFGARYPANAELFVNSVLWLVKLDQLIAAGARKHDIPRIEDISPAKLTALRWTLMVGVPLAVVVAGIGVWLVRRRG